MYQVRSGRKEDLPHVLELIRELAEYERAPDQVWNTVETMEKDGFGENPVYGLLVAEKDDLIIGYSIYYFRYSTWKGKRLFLEDLLVTEKDRGTGAGKQLFDKTVEIARKENCTGMMWQVLDWNKPAIEFYRKNGASFDEEWINCHIDF